MSEDKFYYLDAMENAYEPSIMGAQVIWKTKPTLEMVAQALGYNFPAARDEDTLSIVKIWQGQASRLGDVDYSVEQGSYGKELTK